MKLRIITEETPFAQKKDGVARANILAEHLKPTKGPTTSKDLEPLANPGIWKNRLAETTKDIMLVGHLPHLSKLSGLLLAGNEDNEVIQFRMGGIVCLERNESGRWSTKWMITPKIIP